MTCEKIQSYWPYPTPVNLGKVKRDSVGEKVVIESQFGDSVIATIRRLSKDKAQVDYMSNLGKITVYLPFSELAKEAQCSQGVCKDTLVTIKDYNGDRRDGKVIRVFTNGKILVKYLDRGYEFNIWKMANDLSAVKK